jgi:hypothetical protein
MLRRRGGRPRKLGERKLNGRLRWQPEMDRGHEQMLAQRARLVGSADSREARAGYPLGVLALRGLLADPGCGRDRAKDQTEARLAAGVWFAADHAMSWGSTQPRSHLADLVIGEARGALDERATAAAELRYSRKIAALLGLPYRMPTALTVLSRIVIAEEYAISVGELDTLRGALDALAEIGAR